NAAGCAASTSTNVQIGDFGAPLISCPSPIVTNIASSANLPLINFSVTGSGACGPLTAYSTPPSGSAFPLGVTTVNSFVTNAVGTSNSCAFTITVRASNVVVTTSASAGPGSLRDAITNVAPGGTITFATNLAGSTILLTNGELLLAINMSIIGLGADKLTVS